MKPKKTSDLYKDYITQIFLLILAIVFLAIAVFLEFCCLNEHKDFGINLLLGASASSIISFVMLAIPYKNSKQQETRDFDVACRNIYAKYSYLSTIINTYNSKLIMTRTSELLELINVFDAMYSNMNFYSEEASKNHEIITKQIPDKLKNVPSYLSTLEIFLKDLGKHYTEEEVEIITKKLYDIFERTIDLNSINIPRNEIRELCETNQMLLNSLLEISDGLKSINDSKEILYFNKEVEMCYFELSQKFMKEKIKN